MSDEIKQADLGGYVFEISLSVLNHLGRNLYRNFITVLGEAISNSWDADAKEVRIYIDRENGHFVIKDNGDGMDQNDFQHKFLKVGYSKRSEAGPSSPGKRPYIGAKGIGKLALLSCAKIISVISKTDKTDYVGGVIDNSGLSKAILQELTPDKYPLGRVDMSLFSKYTEGHQKGTIIYFDEFREDIKATIPHLKKLIALFFRFSLVDESFKVYINDDEVTLKDLADLSNATEFIWNINRLNDPYFNTLANLKEPAIDFPVEFNVRGFIATVIKPRYLKISGTEEKVGIDLFVNGRLRERDILRHAPDFSTRYIASYLYGQIHYDVLDEGKVNDDSFTTSREGIIPGDEKYDDLIKALKEHVFEQISNKWDELRLERGEDGDDDNPRKDLKQRRARSLYNISSGDYADSKNEKVKAWLKELLPDAEFNIPAYVDAFVSENLVRKYIKDKSISLTQDEIDFVADRRGTEATHKTAGNVNIQIKQDDDDLFHLEMDALAKLVDPQRGAANGLTADAKTYRPIRNSLMHTARLTREAKERLSSVYENIKGRVVTLLT